MQPRLQTRDTKIDVKNVVNKEKNKISPTIIKTLLARKTFKFDEHVNEYRTLYYTYGVDFVLLKNSRSINSLYNDEAYKEFFDEEITILQHKSYDEDIH